LTVERDCIFADAIDSGTSLKAERTRLRVARTASSIRTPSHSRAADDRIGWSSVLRYSMLLNKNGFYIPRDSAVY
jgi:hypothetical protein